MNLPSELSKLSSVDFSSLLPLVSIKKCFDLASICLKYETQWQQAHIQTQKYNFLIEIKIAKEYLSMREQRSARRRKIVYFAIATQLPLPIPFFRPSYSSDSTENDFMQRCSVSEDNWLSNSLYSPHKRCRGRFIRTASGALGVVSFSDILCNTYPDMALRVQWQSEAVLYSPAQTAMSSSFSHLICT